MVIEKENKHSFRFEDEVPFEKREEEAQRIVARYPTRIPIVCEWLPKSKRAMPPLEKKKFLVPKQMNLGQFRGVINRQLNMQDSTVTLYFTMKDFTSPISSTTVEDLYHRKKSSDGFLYLHFSEETTFG